MLVRRLIWFWLFIESVNTKNIEGCSKDEKCRDDFEIDSIMSGGGLYKYKNSIDMPVGELITGKGQI